MKEDLRELIRILSQEEKRKELLRSGGAFWQDRGAAGSPHQPGREASGPSLALSESILRAGGARGGYYQGGCATGIYPGS